MHVCKKTNIKKSQNTNTKDNKKLGYHRETVHQRCIILEIE